jgi:hypothetical protein
MTYSGTRPALALQRRTFRLGALAALALAIGCNGGIVGSTSEAIEPPDEVVAVPLPEFENTAPLVTAPAPVAPPVAGVVAGGRSASDDFAVAVTFGAIQSDSAAASGRFRVQLGASAPSFDEIPAPSTTTSR